MPADRQARSAASKSPVAGEPGGAATSPGSTSAATVLPFHRHEPALTITRQVGAKVESIVCPCKVCGKVMEFPVETDDAS